MTQIATRPIGQTGLRVSEIGFGGAALGNLYRPVSDEDAATTLVTALDAGIGFVDTAPYYGFGLSERRVGDGIRGRAGVVLSTKVGRLLTPDPAIRNDGERHGFRSPLPFTPVYDYSHDGILRSWEASLHRLGVARIDLLLVHDIGRVTHGDDHAERFAQLTRGGGFRALERLKAEGAIAGYGIGVNEVEACLDCLEVAPLDAILLAGRYTLLEQGALDRLLPECSRRGTSVIIGGAFNSGILASGTHGDTVPYYNYAPAPPEIITRVRRIEQVCARYEVPLAAAALRFPLAHPCVASVIPGLDSPDRVRTMLALHTHNIPPDFWAALREARLLHPDAPVPAVSP